MLVAHPLKRRTHGHVTPPRSRRLSGAELTNCNAGLGDLRSGAIPRPPGVWQAMTVLIGATGAVQWIRTDSYRAPGKRTILTPHKQAGP